MREIKFRYYDKSSNSINYPKDGWFDKAYMGDNGVRQTTQIQTLIRRHDDGHGILEQFTGIKDFQKVDAYEGDKLRDEDDPNGYFLIEWNDKEARFEINSYGYAMYHNENGGEEYSKEISLLDQNLYDLSMLSEFEIIGNIHDE